MLPNSGSGEITHWRKRIWQTQLTLGGMINKKKGAVEAMGQAGIGGTCIHRPKKPQWCASKRCVLRKDTILAKLE